MTPARFTAITRHYPRLRVAVAGDFCLDRYLEIDAARNEISIETGLPVYNVTRVRAQPGGAGTVLNNLAALGVAELFPIGFAGEDGEGFELRRALATQPGVRMKYFLSTGERRTFTYTKPLLVRPGRPPRELNRLDFKNRTPTSPPLQRRLCDALRKIAARVDAIIILDQVDAPETGVVTKRLLRTIAAIRRQRPHLLIMADSRRGLKGFPPVCLKMNRAELSRLVGARGQIPLPNAGPAAAALARAKKSLCFVTLAEHGMLGTAPDGAIEHRPALPTRGEIDIVGAGDCVTANLTAALAAGATPGESLEIAAAAASVVIHKLGATGAASTSEIKALLWR